MIRARADRSAAPSDRDGADHHDDGRAQHQRREWPAFREAPTWRRTLPLGGWLAGWEPWAGASDAARWLESLYQEVEWSERSIVIAGREVMQPRLVAWYGDPHAVYTYSGRRNEPLEWTPTLGEVRDRLHATTGVRFDSVLANLYRDERDAMGIHADLERELGPEPLIASVSLGATRRFLMRARDRHAPKGANETLSLRHDTLLLMGGVVQQRYKHGVPRESTPHAARINLTFRRVHR